MPFILAGIGMGLFFAPIANVVLSAVHPDQEGKASGATNTIREVGGVFGVAVLAAIFSANGDYGTPAAYVAGLQPAIAVGAVVVGIGAIAALFIPARAGARALVSPSRRRRGRRARRRWANPPEAPPGPPLRRRVRGPTRSRTLRACPPSSATSPPPTAPTCSSGTGRPTRPRPAAPGPGRRGHRSCWSTASANTPAATSTSATSSRRPVSRYDAYDHRGHGRIRRAARRRRALVAVPRRPRRAAGGRPGRAPTGRPVVLYGHSLGGLIAAGYLLSDRPKPDLAVLTSPALDSTLPGWKKRLAPILVAGRADARAPERHRRRDPVARPVGRREDRRRPVLRQGHAPPASGRRRLAEQKRVRGAARRGFGIPTLVLHGEDDGLVPASASEILDGAPLSSDGPIRACATSSTTSPRARPSSTRSSPGCGNRRPARPMDAPTTVAEPEAQTPIGCVAGGRRTGRAADGWRNVRQASSRTAPNPNRLAIAPTNGTIADDLQDDQPDDGREIRPLPGGSVRPVRAAIRRSRCRPRGSRRTRQPARP